MSKPNLFAVLGGVAIMALALIAPEAASAQTRGRPAAAAAATPEQNIAAAQAAATAAGLACQVTEATLLGSAAGASGNLYEAACATGPGYLITASTPPQAIDCVLLASQLAKAAANAPAAAAPEPQRRGRRSAEPEVKTVACALPANLDLLRVQAEYAREAGIACQVDQATPIGAAPDGAIVYEIGCAGSDGYRINKEGGVWTKVECLKLVSANGTCEFTTTAEQSATVQALLVGTDADDCAVEQARFMGGNANGEFYEAKCGGGTGYILRVKEAKTEQIYSCATARQIGGGCTLTAVPAAEPAAAPATR